MRFLRNPFKRATGSGRKQVEKLREKSKPPAKKPVPTQARLLAEGAVEYPAFVKACNRLGIRENEKIIDHFEQLYNWYSQSPVLGSLGAHLEFEAGDKIRNEAFDEVVFWADVMMANRLERGKKILIPTQYVESYRRIANARQKRKQ